MHELTARFVEPWRAVALSSETKYSCADMLQFRSNEVIRWDQQGTPIELKVQIVCGVVFDAIFLLLSIKPFDSKFKRKTKESIDIRQKLLSI